MVFLIFAMLVATGVGVAVVAVVAVPAHRDGRDLLTAKSARRRRATLGRHTADSH